MNKLPIKSKSEITYLPKEELRIEVTLKKDWYFYFEQFYRFVVLPIFLISLALYFFDYLDQRYQLFIQMIFFLFHLPLTFVNRPAIPKSITFTPNQINLKFLSTSKVQKEMRVGYNSLYFEVKVLPNLVELRIEDYTIPLEKVADFPVIIDAIAELWELEYFDTFHTPRDSEILIYKPKSGANFEPVSQLNFEQTFSKVKVFDKMNLSKWFEIDTNIGEINNSKFDKTVFQSKKVKRIEIMAMIDLKSYKSKVLLKVAAVYDSDESQYIFESDGRLKKDELVILRDMKKIYETLVEIDALEDVEIVKRIV